MFSQSTLGNYCLDSFFGNFIVEWSLFADSCQQSELLHTTQVGVINCTNLVSDNVNLDVNTNLWFLYFDGSKSSEGVGVGCILKDPKGNKHMIACILEFQCTNNIVEYEALIQGLKNPLI
jgi:hypothetical protein